MQSFTVTGWSRTFARLGKPGLPGPSPEIRKRLMAKRPANPTREEAVALGAALLFIAGPAHAELAALDLIRFMPQELDIVIGVDPGATAGTEFYKQVKARAGLAQLDQGIAAMEEEIQEDLYLTVE